MAIGHDSRNNSRLFSEQVASIFRSQRIQGIPVRFATSDPGTQFRDPAVGMPERGSNHGIAQPQGIQRLQGILGRRAQVTPPHDKNIIAEVEKITSPREVLTTQSKDNITILDETFDEIYLDAVHGLSLSPEAIAANRDMKIVYTPLHGRELSSFPHPSANSDSATSLRSRSKTFPTATSRQSFRRIRKNAPQ